MCQCETYFSMTNLTPKNQAWKISGSLLVKSGCNQGCTFNVNQMYRIYPPFCVSQTIHFVLELRAVSFTRTCYNFRF